MRVNIGDKVYLPDEKYPWTVRARDERYIICTKPYNPKHTVRYFVIDLYDKVRGTDNMVFCNGYETDEQCLERLDELQRGLIEISHRNRVPLDVEVE